MKSLDNADRIVLELLRLYGLVHCSGLARYMQRSRDFMKERVYKLEQLDLVRTVSNPGRKNIKLLALTPKGNEIAFQGYSRLRQSST